MKKDGSLNSNVSIVDGKLILSLPEADMPVVWQMDLQAAQSSAFTVDEDKKKKLFNLILKNHDGAVQEIAAFKEKKDAVDILMKTSSALQNAHGLIKDQPQAANNQQYQNRVTHIDTKNDKMGAILAVCLILLLLGIWMIGASGKLSENGTISTANTQASSSNPRETSGVAVSADDFLNNR
tara:strand:+ start:458 stop:1000 length:543 start_codon:yes stop_codon:yes gene_type:complete